MVVIQTLMVMLLWMRIMDQNSNCGSVAFGRNCTSISVARAVMEKHPMSCLLEREEICFST